MPDLTTLLSKFLSDLYAGIIGTTAAITGIRNGDGTAAAPSYSFASDPDTGLSHSVGNTIDISTNTSVLARIDSSQGSEGITLRSDKALQWNSTGFTAGAASTPDTVLVRDGAANTLALKNSTNAQALRLYQTTTGPVHNTLFMAAPTISSGFGGTPSIVAGSTAFAFRVNVGSGGVATSGVIGMPTAVNGWQAIVQDMTNNVATRVTATTTNTITITAAAAWTANDILVVIAVAF